MVGAIRAGGGVAGAAVGTSVGGNVGATVASDGGTAAGAMLGRIVGLAGAADGATVSNLLLTRLGVGVNGNPTDGDKGGSTASTGVMAGAGVAAGRFVGLDLGLRVGRAMMDGPSAPRGPLTDFPSARKKRPASRFWTLREK
jgi:hypothetical protein